MPSTVSLGSSGADVEEAQYLLARRQYLQAPGIDASFGPQTDAAVKAFQGASGLTVDGIVGPNTWAALLSGYAYPPPLLSSGSTGPTVQRLQETLNAGRDQFASGLTPLVVDGIYGPLTASMVQAFQGWGGVSVDGIVGPQTWAVSLHAAGQELASVVGV
jgi:murein L,D-transpeptidase YcbB/YkuD